MRWKTFTSFYSKFIQETVYQISSESPKFCRRYYQKHWSLFYLDTLYISSDLQQCHYAILWRSWKYRQYLLKCQSISAKKSPVTGLAALLVFAPHQWIRVMVRVGLGGLGLGAESQPFHSWANSLPRAKVPIDPGQFAPRNFCSRKLLFPGPFTLWNFRCHIVYHTVYWNYLLWKIYMALSHVILTIEDLNLWQLYGAFALLCGHCGGAMSQLDRSVCFNSLALYCNCITD